MDGFSARDRLYYALTALPIAEETDMFEFISGRLEGMREKYSFDLVSLAHSRSYTIPYEMMEQDGVWVFEPRKALQQVTA